MKGLDSARDVINVILATGNEEQKAKAMLNR